MSDAETAADRLTTDLKHAILRGTYAPGDKLPPERDLAERHGVNRVTVRSALARLESMNLVAIRHGSGCVVQDFKRSGGLELVAALSAARVERGQDADLAADLLELRRALARAVLERLVATPPAARDVRAVAASVDALEAVVRAGAPLEGIAKADLEVFRRIVEATGSVVYMLCLNPISELVQVLPGLAAAIYATPEENVASYRLLVAWLQLPRDARSDAIGPLVAALESHDRAAVKVMRRARADGEKARR